MPTSPCRDNTPLCSIYELSPLGETTTHLLVTARGVQLLMY